MGEVTVEPGHPSLPSSPPPHTPLTESIPAQTHTFLQSRKGKVYPDVSGAASEKVSWINTGSGFGMYGEPCLERGQRLRKGCLRVRGPSTPQPSQGEISGQQDLPGQASSLPLS